jgi:phage baseplate assembly protein W
VVQVYTITKGLYKGFSSWEYQKNKRFLVQDVECVNLDLLNAIYTPRRSRVKMPTFGTLIPTLVFEPLDENTIATVQDELITVFKFDPRVQLINIQSNPNYDSQTLLVSCLLNYIELQVTQPFILNITFGT